METTTDELLQLLSSENLEEELINKSKTLFSQADVVKFSGKKATQAELNEAYTTVETILETHLAREKESKEKEELTDKKTGKGLFSRQKIKDKR